MKEIIPMQNAHATQHTNGHIKSEWRVEENITNKLLFLLPNTMPENVVFKILDEIRLYELEAFNKGIALGKEKTVKVYDTRIDKLSAIIEYTKTENEKLAEALENIYHKNNPEN